MLKVFLLLVAMLVALASSCSGDDIEKVNGDAATDSRSDASKNRVADASSNIETGTDVSAQDSGNAMDVRFVLDAGGRPESGDRVDGNIVTDTGAAIDSRTVADSQTTGDAHECSAWRSEHPEWIFCDDFESSESLVAEGRYFEYDDNDGDFIPVDGVGYRDSKGMRVIWQAGEVAAGGMKLGFGSNPVSYMNKGIRSDEDFREIYYRMYLRMQQAWQGSPAKLSRATVFWDSAQWSQAMIAHLWSDDQEHLLLDPVRCVGEGDSPKCHGYNDFDNMDWIGNMSGTTPIFATDHSDIWYCIEAHVKLNDPGQENGIHEFWIDGNLEARREGLDFVRSYTDYAINAVFFENYWNSGSPVQQERYFDNIIVSTEPIGCIENE